MAAEASVNQLIDEAIARASEATDAAIGYTDQAQTAATTITSIPDAPLVNVPMIVIPDPLGSQAATSIVNFAAEFKTAYDELYGQFAAAFPALFDDFIATYFPNINACLATAEDNWLCNTILYGGTGIPPDIERQIYDRGRDREAENYTQQTQDAAEEWASRGFSLPPGTLVDRQAMATTEFYRKVSGFNRDAAIKNIEIEIENIRFAIAECTKLRLGAVQAAGAYVLAWSRFTPENALAYANGLTGAKVSLYQNSAQYYGAIVAAAGLTLDAEKYNSQRVLHNNANFVNLVNSNTKERVHAAVAAAGTMGTLAAAAAAGLNTLTNLGNVTTVNQ